MGEVVHECGKRPVAEGGREQDHPFGGKAGPQQPSCHPDQTGAGDRRIVDQQGQRVVPRGGAQLGCVRAEGRARGPRRADLDTGVSLGAQEGPGQRRQIGARGAHPDHQEGAAAIGVPAYEAGDELGDVAGVLVEAAEAGRRPQDTAVEQGRDGPRHLATQSLEQYGGPFAASAPVGVAVGEPRRHLVRQGVRELPHH